VAWKLLHRETAGGNWFPATYSDGLIHNSQIFC